MLIRFLRRSLRPKHCLSRRRMMFDFRKRQEVIVFPLVVFLFEFSGNLFVALVNSLQSKANQTKKNRSNRSPSNTGAAAEHCFC